MVENDGTLLDIMAPLKSLITLSCGNSFDYMMFLY